MEQITVVSETLKQDKNGNDFANVKLADGRYVNFMFDNFAAYEGTGNYEAEITKDGKFWNVTKGTLKRAQNGATRNKTEEKLDSMISTVKSAHSSNTAQIDTNRSILVQVCIKSAAEAYGGRPGAEPSHDGVIKLAGEFLKWAEKNLATPELEDLPF